MIARLIKHIKKKKRENIYMRECDMLSHSNRTVAKIIATKTWVENDKSLSILRSGYKDNPIIWCKPILRYIVNGVTYETKYLYIPQDGILSDYLVISYNPKDPNRIEVIGSLVKDSPYINTKL